MTEIYIFTAVLVISALFIFKKSRSFFKAMITSAVGGIGALCAVGAVSYFVPITIGINWLTILISALFSVPGVIIVLLLNVFSA